MDDTMNNHSEFGEHCSRAKEFQLRFVLIGLFLFYAYSICFPYINVIMNKKYFKEIEQ